MQVAKVSDAVAEPVQSRIKPASANKTGMPPKYQR